MSLVTSTLSAVHLVPFLCLHPTYNFPKPSYTANTNAAVIHLRIPSLQSVSEARSLCLGCRYPSCLTRWRVRFFGNRHVARWQYKETNIMYVVRCVLVLKNRAAGLARNARLWMESSSHSGIWMKRAVRLIRRGFYVAIRPLSAGWPLQIRRAQGGPGERRKEAP